MGIEPCGVCEMAVAVRTDILPHSATVARPKAHLRFLRPCNDLKRSSHLLPEPSQQKFVRFLAAILCSSVEPLAVLGLECL